MSGLWGTEGPCSLGSAGVEARGACTEVPRLQDPVPHRPVGSQVGSAPASSSRKPVRGCGCTWPRTQNADPVGPVGTRCTWTEASPLTPAGLVAPSVGESLSAQALRGPRSSPCLSAASVPNAGLVSDGLLPTTQNFYLPAKLHMLIVGRKGGRAGAEGAPALCTLLPAPPSEASPRTRPLRVTFLQYRLLISAGGQLRVVCKHPADPGTCLTLQMCRVPETRPWPSALCSGRWPENHAGDSLRRCRRRAGGPPSPLQIPPQTKGKGVDGNHGRFQPLGLGWSELKVKHF